MTVEGMWKFQSGSIDAPNTLLWGGIVILESNRVFGGDSVMAYLGKYQIDNGFIRADVRSWTWNTDLPGEEVSNVFGMSGPVDFSAVLEGSYKEGEIVGELWPQENSELRLAARMLKISDLP